MTREQAIQIASDFAKREGIKIGSVLNVLYDPIIRLHELWEPEFASLPPEKRPNQWVIVFDIPDTTLDPGTAIIGVNDESGRALLLDNL